MKAKFLKLAGVKTEKEFYEKFPTEEAFMAKYGKELKAQFGLSAVPFLGQAVSAFGQGGGNTQNPSNMIGDAFGILSSGIQGFQALGQEKERAREATQARVVSDAALMAVQSDVSEREEMNNRMFLNNQYRPEANISSGYELFPIQGVGSNVLAKNGHYMKKMHSLKDYQNGGEIPHLETYGKGIDKVYAQYINEPIPIGKMSGFQGQPATAMVDTTGLSRNYDGANYVPFTVKYDSGLELFDKMSPELRAQAFDRMYPLRKNPMTGERILNAPADFEQKRLQSIKDGIPNERGMNTKVSDRSFQNGGFMAMPLETDEDYENKLSDWGRRMKMTSEQLGAFVAQKESDKQYYADRDKYYSDQFKTWRAGMTDGIPNTRLQQTDSAYRKFWDTTKADWLANNPRPVNDIVKQYQMERKPMLPPMSEGLATIDEEFQNGGFLGYTGQQWGQAAMNQLPGYATQAVKNFTGSSGGQQIGSAIGKGLGMINPVLGAVAEPILGIAGDLLLSRGNRRTIKREGEYTQSNMNKITGFNMGRTWQNNNRSFAKNGMYMDGGQVQPLWGGNVKTLSYNPFAPGQGDTAMITGNSHKQGGVGLQYGNNIVEAEGGEPIVQMENGGQMENSVAIMGALKVPKEYKMAAEDMTNEKIKGNNFKNFVKSIGELENKQTRAIDRNVKKAEDLTPLNKLDRISLATLDLNINKVHTPKLEALQDAKEGAAMLQETINSTAKELNLDAPALSKGKIQKAKYGKKMGYAQNGTTTGGAAKQYTQQSKNDSGLYGEVNQEALDSLVANNSHWFDFSNFDATNSDDVLRFQQEYNARTTGRKVEEDGKMGNQTASIILSMPVQAEGIQPAAPVQATPNLTPIATPTGVPAEEPESKLPNLGALTYLPQLWNNTDAEPFDHRQIIPELNALVNNQLEPVQARLYNPMLESPVDISMQTAKNDIISQDRAMQRLYANSPGMEGINKAQTLDALNKVNEAEMIANQQNRAGVRGRNIGSVNQARQLNLNILADQFAKQSQARSNTKATTQAALNSISDKISRQALENRTLRIYENMYDYRFDPSGRARYLGPPANFDDWQPLSPNEGTTDTKNYEYLYDANGKPVQKRVRQDGVPTRQLNTNTKRTNVTAITKNGSIVKKYKEYK